MSRFTDTLERNLEVIADRATPSTDAWAQIQSRIDAEDPIQKTEIIMLTENTLTKRRWPLVAAAAALAVIAVGAIALVNRGDDVEVPADPVPTTVETVPQPEAVDEPTITPLPSQGAALDAGQYSFDSMGLPVEFDIPVDGSAPWIVNINYPLAVAIGTDDGFVGFQRIGSFYDADQAQDPTFTGLGSIAPDDVDAWIEANAILVDASSETTIDGRTATFRQVRVPEGAGVDLCPLDQQPCIRLNSVSADLIEENPRDGSELDGPFANAYWFVELDGFEPLGIWAFALDGEMDAWLEEIAPIIDSITLGDPAPAVEGGTARVPLRATETAAFESVRTPGEALDDGTTPVASMITVTGTVDGEIVGAGTATTREPGVDEEGFDDNTFTGTIVGLGSGTVTYTLEWQLVGGVYSSTGLITGGTGDFAGAEGTVATSIRTVGQDGQSATAAGTMTFYLAVPRSG